MQRLPVDEPWSVGLVHEPQQQAADHLGKSDIGLLW
jgi:hypothetical protein